MTLDLWKKQADYAMRVLEELIEGSMKIRELELEAATQAHADAEATRRAIGAASDPSELARLHTEWARSNAQKLFEHWRSVSQAVMETNAALVRCAYAEVAVPLPEQTMLGSVDGAYKQWLDAIQRLYRPAEKAAA